MVEELFNHLWQSTLYALAAALLTLIFQKDSARVRFLIWFTASAKFLVPFSVFVWIGEHVSWEAPVLLHVSPNVAVAMDQIARPAAVLSTNLAATPLAKAAAQSHWNGGTILLSIWLLGFVVLICRRLFQWLYLLAVAQASTPLDIDAPIPVHETASNVEPGVFGIISPTLLVPAGITSQLAPAQLDAVLAHELCHWRRGDNLTAAIHMLVEALFWFHPLVWWLGSRLIVERERACDEAVIQSGTDRHAYAEGVLRVCQRYVDTSLWSAGVSGGILRNRIEEIMTNPVLGDLSLPKKCLLAAVALVAIVGPVAAGRWVGSGVARADEANSALVRRYRSSEWKFGLDLPSHWLAMPPTSSNNRGPREVMRFMSNENGDLLLIVSRHTYDPRNENFQTILDSAQQDMAKHGFLNFVPGETTVGSKRVRTLDFERAPKDGEGVWYCRNYYVIGNNVGYILAFGTRNITAAQRDAVFRLYDRMAKSFVFEDQ